MPFRRYSHSTQIHSPHHWYPRPPSIQYGILQDRAEAERWYQKAAAQGDERAQRALRLKGGGLNFWGKITLWAMFFGFLQPLRVFLTHRERALNSQQRTLAVAGLFGITYVGFRLYDAFCAFQSLLTANLFDFVESLALGVTVAMFITMIGPKIVKITLAVAGAALIAITFLLFANHDGWSLTSTPRGFGSIDGFLSGISISLIILLWLAHQKSKSSEPHSVE